MSEKPGRLSEVCEDMSELLKPLFASRAHHEASCHRTSNMDGLRQAGEMFRGVVGDRSEF